MGQKKLVDDQITRGKWCQGASKMQLERLRDAIAIGAPLPTIAAMIWVLSDDGYANILDKLRKETE